MHHGLQCPDEDSSHAAARELMVRVQQGDREAFQRLYDLHAGTIYSVAMKILGNETAAQDVMQDVFCKVWSASAQYDPGLGKVVAWMITITRHQCLNRIRSEQRRDTAHRHSAAEQNTAGGPGPEQSLIRRETAAAVLASLQSLPPDQSEAIRLAFFQNLTHESAAAALNVPLGTLKARIRRGLLRLQEALQFVR